MTHDDYVAQHCQQSQETLRHIIDLLQNALRLLHEAGAKVPPACPIHRFDARWLPVSAWVGKAAHACDVALTNAGNALQGYEEEEGDETGEAGAGN